ncbi:MAG: hypothetical protein M3N53_05985 [Actinomycetota bacterium]|nr:hypothetical protein [Actinomycetota bacterium]
MGFADKQKVKVDERIRTLVASSLEPGEAIREQFQAMTLFRFWPVFLGAFPIAFYLEYTGRGDLVPWLMGLSIGAYFVIKVRTYLLVLTDRRLLILLLRRMSAKRLERTDTYTRGDVSEASFSDGFLNGRLNLRTHDATFDLKIGVPFKDRARRLVDDLRAPKD